MTINLRGLLPVAPPSTPFTPRRMTLHSGRAGLAVDCIPFSRRKCEPCYLVLFDTGGCGWVTEDEIVKGRAA